MTGAPMQATSRAGPSDPLGAEHSLVVPDPLRGLDQAGLLRPVDVHGARTLCRIADDDRDEVLLAVALAVRSPRLGSVCVDLSTIAGSLVAEGDVGQDLEQLVEWPDLDAWRDVLVASPLVGRSGEDQTPLVLDGTRLYLDRYWRYEQRVVEELVRRASREALDVDLARLREGIDRLLPRRHDGERPDRQRLAAAMAVLRQLTVVAGGPGTGKTTTVAAMLALLHEQATAAGQPPPRVALAAPTGKAAARLTGALHEASGRLALADAAGQALRDAEAGTLHRLLGMRPGAGVRSRHHRRAPLPHDVVVVDETSMVSLSLIARLLDAVRPDARLVLLGDPHQLASVEAGSVLGDVVGPVGEGLVASTPTRDRLAESTAEDRAAIDALTHESGPARLADGIVVLRRVHRFDESSAIAALARAVHEGDVTRAMQVLEDGDGQVHWLRPPDDPATDAWLLPVRDRLVEVGGRLLDAARRGDARDAPSR